jgi:Protein of unknown function (DUF3140)
MTPRALEQWLKTDESKSVGQRDNKGSESVGHESGRRNVKLLPAKQGDYSDENLAHMRKVVGYVHRHLAQRPSGEVEHSAWCSSPINGGHDPLK